MYHLRAAVLAATLIAFLSLCFSTEGKQQNGLRRSQTRQKTERKRLTKPQKRSPKREFEIKESISDDGDEVEARQSWFMRQRTYPFGTLPIEARRRAWNERPSRVKGFEGSDATTAIWSPLGPMPTYSYAPLFANFNYTSGRINSIAVSPANPQLVLIGASTGGIWRSTDGGLTFSPVSDAQVDLAVGSIVFAPSNPSIVYAGMGDMHSCCEYLGSGVLKSLDGGATWTRVNNATLPQPASVGDIAVDPNNPNKIYLALYRSLDATNANSFPFGGVYISNDGGVNWAKVLSGLPRDIAINPANPQIIYAAMRGVGTFGNGGVGGVYRSVNGGSSWTVTYTAPYAAAFDTNGIRDIRVAVSPANPQRVYVYLGNLTTIRFAVSSDNGATFPTDNLLTTVDDGQFGYNTYLQADPNNADAVFIGSRDVYRSLDAGKSWVNLTNSFGAGPNFPYQPRLAKAHPDQHAIAFIPNNQGVFFIGNDGGLYRTNDNGQTFQSLNTTLSLVQFVSLARHPSNFSMTYGGTQDNGTQRRISPTAWEDLSSGDGGNLVINPANPSIFFVTYIFGTVWRFSDDGFLGPVTVANPNTFEDERTAFYVPLTGNGTTSQIYLGAQRVWTTTDLGTTWTALGTISDLTRGGTDVLSAIGVSKSNPNVIYTGSEMGRAMVSTDAGHNWTEMTSGLPNRFITGIKVDSSNPAVAYLTVSGFGSGHVFKTTNTGASWTDISGTVGQGGLPNIPVNTLLIDVNNPNLLYVGTDVGVFRSATGGTNWISFNDGMPPVIVTALTANAAGEIQAGTYGRGAYEATIASVASLSGRVLDGFGNPIGGATVTLSGSQSGTTTSDANGNYSFGALASKGNYTLTPSKAGQFTSFPRAINNLSGTTSGFNLQLSPFVIVNVHTADSAGANLSGVAVGFSGSSSAPLTNASGNLNVSLPVPVVGGVQVTLIPIKLGYAFNPPSFTFSTQSGNQSVSFNAILPNMIDNAGNFVRQQYRDFLDRDPDQGGLDYWTARITECGNDQLCIHQRRIDTSAAFFVEAEFQRTGSFVYRLYKGGLARRPAFVEFTNDRAQVIEGPNLEQTKQALTLAFVQRQEFLTKYASQNTATAFVDAVIASIQQNSGVSLTGIRSVMLSEYSTGGTDLNLSRARALRVAIDHSLFTTTEYNPSFVLMQYFGYLRRNPDQGGYDFWLNILNNREPNNYRSMVCAFLTSAEYQQRFGTSVTRSNRDCGN